MKYKWGDDVSECVMLLFIGLYRIGEKRLLYRNRNISPGQEYQICPENVHVLFDARTVDRCT